MPEMADHLFINRKANFRSRFVKLRSCHEIMLFCRSIQALLTHWSRDKMAAFSQTTSLNAFPWMKMHEFRLKCHWSLFLRVELTIFQQCFRLWLGAVQATSHNLNQWWLVYRRIYASLGLNELTFSASVGTHIKELISILHVATMKNNIFLTVFYDIPNGYTGGVSCSINEPVNYISNVWRP